MSGFDWNDLRFFLEVARIGTLSGAARALGTDHATVGRRISALEHGLGRTLFHRSLSGYAMTPSGETLLVQAEQMEALALRTTEGTAQPGASLGGVVRLTTPDGFGNFFLAPRLHEFATAFPRLSLQLVPIQQIQSQTQREGDVSVTLTPGGARFAVSKLVEYGLGLYASSGFLSGKPAIEKPDDLRNYPLVGYVDDLLFSRELDYLGDILPALRARIQCASLLSQVEATVAGTGICVLPHYLARRHASLKPVLPSVVELRRTYWLNVALDSTRIPRVKAVADFLRVTVEAMDFG